MRQLPPLAALRAFEAAARRLSFRHAADELGVTPTAISHQVRLLEETLGTRLFERRPRRVALTQTGADLFPVLQAAFASIGAAVARIRDERRNRAITLSAPTAFAAKWLVPRLAAFGRANPDVDLRLHASDEPVDLDSGRADAAIRYGDAPFAGLIAEPLFEEYFAVMCSPRLGVATPADLEHQVLLHSQWHKIDELTPSWRRWCSAAGIEHSDTTAGVTFTDDGLLIQAAVAGQGVALASPVLAAAEIASGLLVQPFGPALAGRSYHLVHTGRPEQAEAVAAVRSWLAAELAGG